MLPDNALVSGEHEPGLEGANQSVEHSGTSLPSSF
jgi:hypothetical protein